MKMRIQPREIEVPEDNPFRHDLLGRKEQVDILTHLIRGFEGPCVLAVDAAWGTGKTTFMRMWSLHLRNEGFPVVEFNAWETDFSGEPFVALSTELTEGLHEYTKNDEKLTTKIAETKTVAIEVLRRALPSAIRLATAGLLDLNALTEKELGKVLGTFAKEKLSEYHEAQKSVEAFRHKLQDLAESLAESGKNPPLIVMIDELDRCRPPYAVELLEVAKHLFSVDHIVFVLAVNRLELSHSIKSLYGSGFDAVGYLRRFIDIDFRLPDPEREAFIKTTLDAIRIDEYFARTQDATARHLHRDVRQILIGFFSTPEISLRRVTQALHRLGLVLASLRSDHWSYPIMAVLALILRTIDSDLYRRFHCGDVTDLEVVEKVFAPSGAITLEDDAVRTYAERMIILAGREVSGSTDSPLLERYKDMVDAEDAETNSEDPHQKRAQQMIAWAENLQSSGLHIGFMDSVQRIELLSAGLIGEHLETGLDKS